MCYSPITLKNPKTGTYSTVPCGKCLECLKAEQENWNIRMAEEFKNPKWHSKAVFFTLTYTDRTVPKAYLFHQDVYKSPSDYYYQPSKQIRGRHVKMRVKPSIVLEENNIDINECQEFNSLCLEDIQKWIKRYRKSLPEGREIAYFYCGEYGKSNNRPHYHGIVYGVNKDEFRSAINDWKEHYGGLCTFENIYSNGAAFAYCAKYCAKGYYKNYLASKDYYYAKTQKEYHSRHYEYNIKNYGIDAALVEKEFRRASKGLGACFVTPEIREYYLGKRDEVNTKITNDSSLQEQHTAWFKMLDVKDEDSPAEYIINNFKKYTTRDGYEKTLPKYLAEKIYGPYILSTFSKIVSQRNEKIRDEKFRALYAQNPAWSPEQVDAYLFEEERTDYTRRREQAFKMADKFYSKGRL